MTWGKFVSKEISMSLIGLELNPIFMRARQLRNSKATAMFFVPDDERLTENPRAERRFAAPNFVINTHHIEAPRRQERSKVGYLYSVKDGDGDGDENGDGDEDKDGNGDEDENGCIYRQNPVS